MIAFILILSSGRCLAQHSIADKFKIDSLFPSNISDTLNVKEFTSQSWIDGNEGAYKLNSLHGVQNYHPTYENSLVQNDLGNIGSAEHPVLYGFQRDFGFHFRGGRDSYWRPISQRKLLVSERMFTNVQYSNGVNRENYLSANFTRGFGQLINLGFNFTRINSQGFYELQRNTITDFSIFGTVRSKDSRYRAVVMFIYSNLKLEENGGIANDSVFEQNLTSGRNFISVNLPQSYNHWKGFDLGLDQRFFLFKQDSVGHAKKFQPALFHSFSAGRSSMVYHNVPDTTSSFYENILMDTSATYDSTNLLGVTNTLKFELLAGDSAKKRVLEQISVGASHTYHRVTYDSSFVQDIHNVSVLGNLKGELFEGMRWNANAQFMVYGYNILDLKVDGGFKYTIGKSSFNTFVDYNLYRPDFITSRYESNHFAWSNDWQQTQHLQTGLVYDQTRLRFRGSFTYHIIDNLVLYGTDRLPFQSGSVNQIMVLRLQEHFRFRWVHLVLDGAVQWQLTGDDIRVPIALGRGMLYYQNDLFKKRLRLQVGVETSYAMGYFANGYNPALSAFHLQNDKQVGNYPFIDAFLNLRVKKLRMFVKFTHINAGWLGYRYYHVPSYPVNDFAWHFGINWAFLD
ncbi:MAG: hypothetical protein H6603_05195 [Flavobacteriales bacterium]|nr:hypothetical protein [Flavobacteriales bacterium]